MTSDEIYKVFYHHKISRGFLHSHSYTGNPLACRAALATLDIFAKDKVLAANQYKATYLNQITMPLREHHAVRNWRNMGMIWAFDVLSPCHDFSQRFAAMALQNELLLRPIGNTVYFMPPYIIGNDEMDLLVQSVLHIVNQLSEVK